MANTSLEILISAKDLASKEMEKVTEGIKGMSNEAKKMSTTDASKKVLGGMAVGAAVAGTALVGFGASVAKEVGGMAEELGTLSQKTGIGVDSLLGLKFVAEQNNTSFDSLAMSMQKMGINLVGAQSGNEAAVSAFGKLGISIDTIKKLSPEDQFQAIADGMQTLQTPAEQAAVAMEIFGKGGMEILPVLNTNIDETIEKGRSLGVVFSEDMIKKAQEYDTAMDDLKGAMDGFKIQAAAVFLPIATEMAEKALKVITAINDWVKAQGGLEGVIKNAKTWMEEHRTILLMIAGAIVAVVVPAIWAMIGAFATFVATAVIPTIIALAPLLIGGAVIGGIVAGIWWLVDNWGLVKETFNKIWATVMEKFTAIKNTWTSIVNAIKDTTTAVFDSIKTKIQSVIDFIEAQIEKIKKAVDKVKEIGSSIIGGSSKDTSSSTSKKASGGTVVGNRPYLVGEQGMEMFVPNTTGRIIPNHQLGNGGTVVNVYMGSGTYVAGGGMQQLARMVGEEFMTQLRFNTQVGL